MIRRDYILRMIQEFMQVLSRIRGLKQAQQLPETARALDEEFQRLLGNNAEAIVRLSEIELLAKLIQGEPTQSVREKTLMVTALLKEAGDLAAAQGSEERSRICYLKGMHLLLHALAQADTGELPEFVPKIELFLAGLERSALPAPTHALLMQHYERIGDFAKAEDSLFTMLESDPDNPGIIEFGIAFYDRLATKDDSALAAGNLPRTELEAGLAELQTRKSAISK